MIHVMIEGDTSKSCERVGSTILTMFISSTDMQRANEMATIAHILWGRGNPSVFSISGVLRASLLSINSTFILQNKQNIGFTVPVRE